MRLSLELGGGEGKRGSPELYLFEEEEEEEEEEEVEEKGEAEGGTRDAALLLRYKVKGSGGVVSSVDERDAQSGSRERFFESKHERRREWAT